MEFIVITAVERIYGITGDCQSRLVMETKYVNWILKTSCVSCNGIREIMTDQTGNRTWAPWISTLEPLFTCSDNWTIWCRSLLSLPPSPSKTVTPDRIELSCQFQGLAQHKISRDGRYHDGPDRDSNTCPWMSSFRCSNYQLTELSGRR